MIAIGARLRKEFTLQKLYSFVLSFYFGFLSVFFGIQEIAKAKLLDQKEETKKNQVFVIEFASVNYSIFESSKK